MKMQRTNPRPTIPLRVFILKKSAIKDHLLSHQHKDVIEAEMLSSVAVSQGSYREREGKGCSLNECFPGCLVAS